MKRCISIVIALLALLPPGAEAHRLDEYLQTTRVAVTPDGLEIELDLTPGAAVATSVFPLIDRDGDLRVTPPEIEAYARRLLNDLALQVDGRGYLLTLTRAECPSWPELRDGMGTITMVATVDVP